jgi:oxygen-independent coproporphyrinogen III oxidase
LISLYFHIPFCSKKCSYCHFYVIPEKDSFKKQLLEGFQMELEQWQVALSQFEIKSIYFGGGTPALIGAEAIRLILSHVKKYSTLVPSAEITLEANPENMTAQQMRSYADVGINRVSVGIQSLDDALLAMLGRTHSSKKAIDAVHAAVEGTISNVTVDLMYDLPGQNLGTWKNTLQQIVQLPISHLSLYNLTIEPHTAFFKRKEQLEKLLPSQEISLEMYEMATEMLELHGLKQYEISAFARNGLFSRHNVGYWTGRPFIGLGPSAFSYWEGSRFRNIANLNQYHKRLEQGISPIDFTEKLDPLFAKRELLAIHLRLMEGIDLKQFEKVHGCLDPETTFTLLSLESNGFLQREEAKLKLTRKGILFYDTVASEIV